jgi:hypothetical protein
MALATGASVTSTSLKSFPTVYVVGSKAPAGKGKK